MNITNQQANSVGVGGGDVCVASAHPYRICLTIFFKAHDPYKNSTLRELLPLLLCYTVPWQIQISNALKEGDTMIQGIAAMVLFVRDLGGCTAFYRDIFKLPYQGSDADSSTFLLQEGLYLILLSPTGTADLLGTEVNKLQIEGGPRGLLAA